MTAKRIVDIAVSASLLLLLGPLMLAVSAAIALTMGTPVIFCQKRPGWRGKRFNVYKFRTMTDRTDDNGELLPDSDRATPLGQFLRDTSLDELPQLINVLLGEMSIVGPRPLVDRFVRNCTHEQRRRFDVRPGITGWAQIHGRKGLDYDRRFELDVWYVDHQSLLLDIRIIFATPSIVLRQDGIVETGEVVYETAPHAWPSELIRLPATGSELHLHAAHIESSHIAETANL
jgi:sugar transferase EpsL